MTVKMTVKWKLKKKNAVFNKLVLLSSGVRVKRWWRFETRVFRMQSNTVMPQPVFLHIHLKKKTVSFVIY